MGRIVTFGGEKGGGGKSTLTIHMAICALLRGLRVLVLDCDRQRTTVQFCEWRNAIARAAPERGLKPVLCLERRGDLFFELQELAPGYDLVLVDVAGAATPQLTSAVNASDVLFTPLYPSEPDLNTAEKMSHVVDLARAGGNRDLRARFVLNCVEPKPLVRKRQLAFSREKLEPYAHNYAISAAVIHTRDIVRKAYSLREAVTEIARSPLVKVRRDSEPTANEIWTLYREMMNTEEPRNAAV